MHRVIIVLSDLVGDSESWSALQGNFPVIQYFSENSMPFRIAPLGLIKTPEAAYFGLDPTGFNLEQGPLTISALGVDPLINSVHFHLSLLSLDEEGMIKHPEYSASDEEIELLIQASEKLNSRFLTIVKGEQLDHGLVWEKGSLDLKTISAAESVEKHYKSVLPEGEGERQLRQLIEDSVNLLDTLELNQKRRDKGLKPINILWPWGQGFRLPAPNLALLRGEPAWVESGSMRISGLSHLVHYQHGDRRYFGQGLKIDYRSILDRILKHTPTIIILDKFTYLRKWGRKEEMLWLLKQIEDLWLKPILEYSLLKPMQITILCPSVENEGLGFIFNSQISIHSNYPFDERLLEEKKISQIRLWEAVQKGLHIKNRNIQ